MFEIIIPIDSNKSEEANESLMTIDLYNICYNAPLEITTDDNGYGYYEKSDVETTLSVFVECEENEVEGYIKSISELLNIKDGITYREIKENNWQQPFEPVDLGNEWVISNPGFTSDSGRIINFESQGAFGTGLHETTQDCLRIILDKDFSGRTVLDLGTGSGILSIAAGIKKAESIIAVDIKDVRDEVLHNANLNNLDNIEVIIEDVMADNFNLGKKFDDVFINIGGEETLASMNFINSVIKPEGELLVSGLVEWSYDDVCDKIVSYGYKVVKSAQTNEWVTTLLKRI